MEVNENKALQTEKIEDEYVHYVVPHIEPTDDERLVS